MDEEIDKGGRPARELTPEEMAQVEGLASVLTREQMADYFGMGRSTLQRLMERDEEVSGLYKRGRAKAIGSVAQGLLQRARDGDNASAIFFLKTQAGWKETSVSEVKGTVVVIAPRDAEL